ncbi:hypothetical protein FHR91_002301 [Erythrobacter lutimaris]|nr:hypothetical protein [Alteriqipengyuania lutimaris]
MVAQLANIRGEIAIVAIDRSGSRGDSLLDRGYG